MICWSVLSETEEDRERRRLKERAAQEFHVALLEESELTRHFLSLPSLTMLMIIWRQKVTYIFNMQAAYKG